MRPFYCLDSRRVYSQCLFFSAFTLFLGVSANGISLAHENLRFYILAAIPLFTLSIFRVIYKGALFIAGNRYEDLLLYGFLFLLVAHGAFAESFNSTYLVVYALVILVFFQAIILLGDGRVARNVVLRAGVYGTFGSLVCTLMIYAAMLFGIEVIPEGLRVKPANAIYGGFVGRNYGLSAEPGALAFYVNTVGLFFVIYALHEGYGRVFTFLFSLTWLLVLLSTFSAAGIISVVIATFLFALLKFRSIPKKALLLLIVLVAFMVVSLLYLNFFESLRGKFLNFSAYSSIDRLDTWSVALRYIYDDPIGGVGLGMSEVIFGRSFISYFLTTFVEVGLLVSLPMVGFFVFSVIRSIGRPGYLAYLSIPVVCGLIHLNSISTFYYPFVFLLVAIQRFLVKTDA